MFYLVGSDFLLVGSDFAIDAACCCAAPAACPTDCSTLGGYTATISNLAGDSCQSCLDDYEAAWSLARSGCTWWIYQVTSISDVYIDVTCAAGVWTAYIDFNCYDGCSIFKSVYGTIPAKADPTGTYNMSGGGITGTMVIA